MSDEETECKLTDHEIIQKIYELYKKLDDELYLFFNGDSKNKRKDFEGKIRFPNYANKTNIELYRKNWRPRALHGEIIWQPPELVKKWKKK